MPDLPLSLYHQLLFGQAQALVQMAYEFLRADITARTHIPTGQLQQVSKDCLLLEKMLGGIKPVIFSTDITANLTSTFFPDIVTNLNSFKEQLEKTQHDAYLVQIRYDPERNLFEIPIYLAALAVGHLYYALFESPHKNINAAKNALEVILAEMTVLFKLDKRENGMG